jgi:hypothetical protein
LALSSVIGHEKRLFLNAQQVKQIADDSRYPSLYQLLPPAGEPFAWNQKPGAELRALDIYESEVVRGLGLNQVNVDAAKEFHSRLDATRRPANVRYFFFIGTRQVTAATVHMQEITADSVETDEVEDGGDGTVPAWSGSMTGFQSQMVGGEHGTIYKNRGLKRTLAALLGRPGVLAAEVPTFEMALRDTVIEPGSEVHITLSFPRRLSEVKGELRTEHAQTDGAGHVSYIPIGVVHRIDYQGLAAEKLGLVFAGPDVRGIYRVTLCEDGKAFPSATDELIVQD